MRGLILATAAVVALGFGGAGAANAWSGHSGSAMGPNTPNTRTMSHSGTSSMRTITGAVSHRRGTVEEAQRMLRRDGFYHGRIDGLIGPQTRHALARYQRQNGLRVTASLTPSTRASLMGHQTVGVGSSMHRHATTSQTGNTGPMPPATKTGGQNTGTGNTPSGPMNTGTTR